jgi:DNA-binding NarL/FixJ family response regulator
MDGRIGSELIRAAKRNLTTGQRREWKSLDQETSRMWRNFWIKVLHEQGCTNVEIANDFEISESTVRNVLKK